jgi:hypothetical protein
MTNLHTLFLCFLGSRSFPCISVRSVGRWVCTFTMDLEVMVWVVYVEYHCRYGFPRLLLDLRVSYEMVLDNRQRM